MKTLPLISFYLLMALIVFAPAIVIAQNTAFKDNNDLPTGCNVSIDEVENKFFQLSKGQKQVITYSISNFNDHDECWLYLKKYAANMTIDAEISGVYFFTLPPEDIEAIANQYNDFSQYGKNLVAEYWKDPDSGEKLVRFPNSITNEH